MQASGVGTLGYGTLLTELIDNGATSPMNYALSNYQKIEVSMHLLFWVFIFASVNVNWQQAWFDTSIRPNTPSPLSVITFPLLFYAHAYWAIPNYLATKKWLHYGFSIVLIFIGPELVRLAFYVLVLNHPPGPEISSRDSFLFGSPEIAWLAFVFSLVYKLFIDRVFTNNQIELAVRKAQQKVTIPVAIPHHDSEKLADALTRLMNEKKLFLDDELKLGLLSDHLGITEKNLSALLNKYMGTTFAEYVNGYRVNHFLKEVENGRLQRLSVSGLMNECGFTSKATFYRAFKKIKGCTPTEWLKSKP